MPYNQANGIQRFARSMNTYKWYFPMKKHYSKSTKRQYGHVMNTALSNQKYNNASE